jgi:hypothetical protein
VGLFLITATSAGCKADIGDPCTSADDCEFGLVCVAKPEGAPTLCQLPSTVADMQPTEMGDMAPADGDL